MEQIEGHMYSPIERVMMARLLIDDEEPRINPTEISKKVNYILSMDNEDPLHLNTYDLNVISEALRNRVSTGDLVTNPNSAFMKFIDSILSTNINKQIDLDDAIRRRQTAGMRRKRHKKTRKIKNKKIKK